LGIIIAENISNTIIGSYFKNNEPQVYLDCIKQTCEKYDRKLEPFSSKNINNCDNLEENQKVYREFIEEAHECKNLYPENKYVNFFDWLGIVFIMPYFEADFYNQKHENKCK
jgi:hypothetical protein